MVPRPSRVTSGVSCGTSMSNGNIILKLCRLHSFTAVLCGFKLPKLGGGFKALLLRKWSNLTHIFQMGWNHQLDNNGPNDLPCHRRKLTWNSSLARFSTRLWYFKWRMAHLGWVEKWVELKVFLVIVEVWGLLIIGHIYIYIYTHTCKR